jgi:hypothetical protein
MDPETIEKRGPLTGGLTLNAHVFISLPGINIKFTGVFQTNVTPPEKRFLSVYNKKFSVVPFKIREGYRHIEGL